MSRHPFAEMHEANIKDQLEPEIDAKQGDSNIASYTDSKIYSDIALKQDSPVDRKQDSDVSIILSMFDATDLTQINIRIPPLVNEWLDNRAFPLRKKGVSKQSIITDAIKEYMLRRLEEEQ